MKRGFGGDMLREPVAEPRQIQPCQQILARPEDDRRHGQVKVVHQPCPQISTDRFDAAAQADILRPGGLMRASASSMPPVTKWNVVPPAIGSEGRG
ncbi:MAG: hypothetical protein WDN24_08020 [Sphingomonas sp.]